MRPRNVPEFVFIRLVADHKTVEGTSQGNDTMPPSKTAGANDRVMVGSKETAISESQDTKNLNEKKKDGVVAECLESQRRLGR
jgi:hypothetical protein